VLRNIGATGEGTERHNLALEISSRRLASPELRIAVLEDLAEERLAAGDVADAERHLTAAAQLLHGDLVFGWRLQFKLDLLRTRAALARDDPHAALGTATSLARRAADLGVPRYAGVARLLIHRARALLRDTVDLDAVAADLETVRQAVAIEAWWWTGEAAAAHRVARWVDQAASQVDDLAAAAGPRGPAMHRAAGRRLDAWRAEAGARPGP